MQMKIVYFCGLKSEFGLRIGGGDKKKCCIPPQKNASPSKSTKEKRLKALSDSLQRRVVLSKKINFIPRKKNLSMLKKMYTILPLSFNLVIFRL